MKKKLIHVLNEGAFGPGSEMSINVPSPWKAKVGAVDNKRRPEALYIIISTWVKPKLNVSSALSATDQSDLATKAAQDFEVGLKRLSPKLRGFFDNLYFNSDSIIFTYSFAATRAAVAKFQFLEIEINIDTVNYIDNNDVPIPNPKTGKIEFLDFNAFKKPIEAAVKKLISDQTFVQTQSVELAKTKRG